MIIKIQRCLYPADGHPMIYNHSRSFLTCMPVPQHVMDQLGDDPKGYFEAQLENGKLFIGKKVPPENW